jgi:hypothetical protein
VSETIRARAATVAVVTSPRRVLIDWDFGAHGIWTVLSPEERSAPRPPGKLAPYEPPRDHSRPWSGLLSNTLLDALDGWNAEGEVLGRKRTPGLELKAFRQRGTELAQHVQQELGSGYQVLYVVAGGAWRWVLPWSQRICPSRATSPRDGSRGD